jgi:putative flippase GtrA
MTSTLLFPALPTGAAAVPAPQVEVVVRASGDPAAVAATVARLQAILSVHFPYAWHVVAGGPSLLEAWRASSAPVRCAIDPTGDPRALLPLVAPLLSGHSDVAIGARPGRLAALGRRIAPDADGGLLAVSASALEALAPDFPTAADDRLACDLVLAARERGLRVFELATPPGRHADGPARARRLARAAGRSRVARFMGIGVLSTLAFALLFLLLRGPLGASGANAAALAITAVANTQANRRLTFGVRGRERLARHHLQGAVVFVLTLGLTQAALLLLGAVAPGAPRGVELAVLIGASVVATVTRFVALRSWVFAAGLRNSDGSKPAPRILRGSRPMLSS